jgi:hypothetical protein
MMADSLEDLLLVEIQYLGFFQPQAEAQAQVIINTLLQQAAQAEAAVIQEQVDRARLVLRDKATTEDLHQAQANQVKTDLVVVELVELVPMLPMLIQQ